MLNLLLHLLPAAAGLCCWLLLPKLLLLLLLLAAAGRCWPLLATATSCPLVAARW